MFMRVNLKQERETAGVLFGGPMAVGTRVISETVCSLDGVSFSEKVDIKSTKETGIMGCSTEEELSIFRMESDTRVPSKKINSMEKEFFTRTTL